MLHVSAIKVSKNLTICALAELIVLAPSISFLPAFITLHDSQRMIALVLLSLVLIHRLFNTQSSASIIPANNKIRYALFIMIALTGISCYLALSSRFALIEVSIFAALYFLALFVAELFQENKEAVIKRITYCLWASILLYMFAFYVGYITACVYKTSLKWPLPFLGFNNIRFFNQYQLWTLGLIYLPLLEFKLNRNIRSWLFVALSFWWVLLFYSASRGILIAWVVGMLTILFIYKKIAWSFLRLQFLTMLSGLGSYLLLFKIIPSFLHFTLITGSVIRDTTSDRLGLWNIAINLINKFPIFGAGPMNYAFYSSTSFHPHNSILQLAAEFGLPATFTLLAIVGYSFYCWLKRFQGKNLEEKFKVDSNFVVLLLFTVVTNFAYSLVDGVIVMPISQVMMFSTIGLMIGQYLSWEPAENINKSTNQYAYIRPAVASLVLIVMIWSTLPEIIHGLSGYERGFAVGLNTINPRLWIQIR